MFKTLKNAWKIEDIRKRMIFTFWMIVVFRLGNALPVPFINKAAIAEIFQGQQGSILEILNMITGGGLETLSVFALGVGPYITSSIVVQLLTVAIPRLEELSKEGEEGRKKIQRLTKYVALVLSIIQAYAIVGGIFSKALASGGALAYLVVITVMVAGSMFIVWIGDLITEKGVGNGLSIIIFIGIISRLPRTFYSWGYGVKNGDVAIYQAILMLLISIFTIVIVVLITEGERKIPVQYAKRVVGRKMYGGQSTHIPIKVNMSGVLPVIFASSLLALPQTIGMLIGGNTQAWIARNLTPQGTFGTIFYVVLQVVLIVLFAYFYNSIQFNPVEYSKNLQQYGGFIPGIRPGRPTSEFLGKIVNRITMVGAIALAFLAVLPTILSKIFSLNVTFGGTSVIIAVGVVLETMRQIEAMMQMRHYKGFLNK